MTTALQRLLKYPHQAVFDKDPARDLALRVRHPMGAKWTIADEVMSVKAGDFERQYDLTQYTIGTLAQALEQDGFQILSVAYAYEQLGAVALVEGEGDEALSNGDNLHVFTSPLWALFSGYASEVREAEYQLQQALRQMIIWQAEREWLDLWGKLYAEGRLPGEADADYAPRIPREAFRIRVNGLAIEQAIKDRTGYNVEIREPWKRMFRLDESALSGIDRFPDDSYYSYFVIHPVARDEGVDWSQVLPVIHRNRAAGIEVAFPVTEFATRHVVAQPPAEFLASMGGLTVTGIGAWPGGEAPLGVMRLDDNEITLNHPVMVYELRTYANAEGAQEDQDFGLRRNIAYAGIVLSDGMPLGDENAIFSRGMLTYERAAPADTLSDELAPSDYQVIARHERVERVILVQHARAIEYPTDEVSAGMVFISDTTFQRHVLRVENDGWTGGWDGREWLGEHSRMGMRRIDKAPGDILNDTLLLNVSEIT